MVDIELEINNEKNEDVSRGLQELIVTNEYFEANPIGGWGIHTDYYNQGIDVVVATQKEMAKVEKKLFEKWNFPQEKGAESAPFI